MERLTSKRMLGKHRSFHFTLNIALHALTGQSVNTQVQGQIKRGRFIINFINYAGYK